MARRNLLALLIAVPLLLGGKGCQELVGVTCLEKKQYSTAFLKEAGREYARLETDGDAPNLRAIVDDWINIREAIDECIKLRDAKRK